MPEHAVEASDAITSHRQPSHRMLRLIWHLPSGEFDETSKWRQECVFVLESCLLAFELLADVGVWAWGFNRCCTGPRVPDLRSTSP
jgi:hypothetical protein